MSFLEHVEACLADAERMQLLGSFAQDAVLVGQACSSVREAVVAICLEAPMFVVAKDLAVGLADSFFVLLAFAAAAL